MKNWFPLFLLVIIVGSSCKKEDELRPIETKEQWVEHPNFTGRNKIQLNCKAFGDTMYSAGLGYYSVFIKGSETKNYITSSNSFGVFQKPPISKDVYVQWFQNWLYFKSGDLSNGLDLSVDMKKIDSTFYQMEFVSYRANECILINDKNQVLVAYRGYNQEKRAIKFVLISIDIWGGYDFKLIEAQSSGLSLLCWSVVEGHFFVSNSESTYKITSDGDSYLVSNRVLYRMFKVDDTIWSIANDGMVFYSNNSGDSWQQFGDQGNMNWAYLYFNECNGNIVAHYQSQIYLFNQSKNNAGETIISIRELDNEGLEGNEITSISYFDNEYYVTTFSGVFSKSEENFFTYVE